MPTQITAVLERLKGAVGQFTLAQRTLAIIGVAGLVLGLVALSSWMTKPTMSPLFSGVSAADASAIVDQLEGEGLVERVDEPADRRAFRIQLTKAGERGFAEMARAHEEWVVELFAGMNKREQDELLKLLAKVKQHAVEVAS